MPFMDTYKHLERQICRAASDPTQLLLVTKIEQGPRVTAIVEIVGGQHIGRVYADKLIPISQPLKNQREGK